MSKWETTRFFAHLFPPKRVPVRVPKRVALRVPKRRAIEASFVGLRGCGPNVLRV